MTAMRRRCSVCGYDPYDRSHQGPNGRCGLCGPPAISKATAPALAHQTEFSLLIDAAKQFKRAAQDARDALNRAGLPCPAPIAFAAERAREALRLLGVKP